MKHRAGSAAFPWELCGLADGNNLAGSRALGCSYVSDTWPRGD